MMTIRLNVWGSWLQRLYDLPGILWHSLRAKVIDWQNLNWKQISYSN